MLHDVTLGTFSGTSSVYELRSMLEGDEEWFRSRLGVLHNLGILKRPPGFQNVLLFRFFRYFLRRRILYNEYCGLDLFAGITQPEALHLHIVGNSHWKCFPWRSLKA